MKIFILMALFGAIAAASYRFERQHSRSRRLDPSPPLPRLDAAYESMLLRLPASNVALGEPVSARGVPGQR